MSKVLKELLTLLKLEQIEETIFRGQSQDLGFGNVFGGQVIGQALSAAKQTVDEDRALHSFHCYFLRPGNAHRPIVYEVDKSRDGRSFTTRRVVAIQNGKPIFNVALSFQQKEEGFDHQHPDMPKVPGPDELISELERVRKIAHLIPEPAREKLTCDRPIELRPVQMPDLIKPEPLPPVRHIWLKANGKLPDDPRVHKYLLAYASDFSFVTTSLNPHAVNFWQPNMQVASIDHAMWFHRDFRMDDWLLYSMESPTAGGARGMARGQIFDRQGRLVASTMQEGLIRRRD
ncbi:acyl-CoA thioesterase II [Sansalvadorimonas sp. 2012CJ34-2]|uniref:Acyl-CoA thioesterase II n=1 Tax=Parendozoicomonas callyspongiae TaxID=2942213 RepID=A0ABT0PCJ0_9GAMM|nr:acyl-CoA thioesterase II [Sansalvadorimonas sp. 2012CJ34-2]MCL6269097.1 acyl-CoA thioesterase II [Sansalvadorimonas sp. 2012CJ34-2]